MNTLKLTLGLAMCGAASLQAEPPLRLAKSLALPGVNGGFNHHAADGVHHRVFVCATTHQSVEVVDLESGQIVRRIATDAKPAATCYAPNLNLLGVSRPGAIDFYEATTFASAGSVAVSGSVDELHYDGTAQQLFAGCMTPPNEGIAVIDLPARRVLKIMPASHPQGFCLEAGGDRVFVSSPRAGGIVVLSRKTSATVATWKLTRAAVNYPVAFDRATHRLFVGCRRPARLVVIDTTTGAEIGDAAIGRDTDDLSFDPKTRRVYVACGDGTISVVQQDDGDRYRTIASVPSGDGGRNCVMVPETNQFCVTVPGGRSSPAKLLVYAALRE